MDKEGERSPPAADANRFLEDDPNASLLWDSWFEPMWNKLVASMRRHYPEIHCQDAEDLAGETLAKIVEHFDFTSIVNMCLADRERRLWAYIRSIRRGVAADFFATRNPETSLPIDIADVDEALVGMAQRSATVVRRALLQLDRWDRKLVTYKAVNRWTFPEIQEEFRRQHQYLELGALKMRYSRALEQLRRVLAKRS
jgi:DNA-directed RNA polymerase specialized sigma24 family protein